MTGLLEGKDAKMGADYLPDEDRPLEFGPFAVYIMTNTHHNVLYTGVTNDLPRRSGGHREAKTPGFTQLYAVTKLVYFELHQDAMSAIEREKQIKAGSRAKKIALIENRNPEWRDLYPELFEEEP